MFAGFEKTLANQWRCLRGLLPLTLLPNSQLKLLYLILRGHSNVTAATLKDREAVTALERSSHAAAVSAALGPCLHCVVLAKPAKAFGAQYPGLTAEGGRRSAGYRGPSEGWCNANHETPSPVRPERHQVLLGEFYSGVGRDQHPDRGHGR